MLQYNGGTIRFSVKYLMLAITFASLGTMCLWMSLPRKPWSSRTAPLGLVNRGASAKDKRARNPTLFYNRIPKTGGTSFLQVVYTLSHVNKFYVYYILINSRRRVLNMQSVNALARNASASQRTYPALYHGHFPYVSLEKSGFVGHPQYINVIRKPLDRLVSYYYFLRFGDDYRPNVIRSRMGQDQNISFDECVTKRLFNDCRPSELWLQVPFFCGGESPCWEPGSSWALERAKSNLVSKYLVVGVSEQMGDFVRLVERILPKFFKGASNIYFDSSGKELRVRLTKTKRAYSKATFDYFKKDPIWQKEQEFYDFALGVFNDMYKRVFVPNNKKSANLPELQFKKIVKP